VTPSPLLAHVAMQEGIVAVERMADHHPTPINYKQVPGCTYCEPQVASIGLTERAAREAGYAVKTGKFPFIGNSKATILGHHEGFIKVVSEEKYGEILGVHIIGPMATEIIAESVAGAGSTVDDV
jgi:dihydrolipoamide dehydrogenase